MYGRIALMSGPTLALLLGAPAGTAAASPGTGSAASIVIFGDSGYIPSCERLDEDDPPRKTLGDYLAAEARDWLEHSRLRLRGDAG